MIRENRDVDGESPPVGTSQGTLGETTKALEEVPLGSANAFSSDDKLQEKQHSHWQDIWQGLYRKF